jgi:hypothetical protein
VSSGFGDISYKAKGVQDSLLYRLEDGLFRLPPPLFTVLDVGLERGGCLLVLALAEPEVAPSAWRSLRLRLFLRLRGFDTCVHPSLCLSRRLCVTFRFSFRFAEPHLPFCSPRFAFAFAFLFVEAPGLCWPLSTFFETGICMDLSFSSTVESIIFLTIARASWRI